MKPLTAVELENLRGLSRSYPELRRLLEYYEGLSRDGVLLFQNSVNDALVIFSEQVEELKNRKDLKKTSPEEYENLLQVMREGLKLSRDLKELRKAGSVRTPAADNPDPDKKTDIAPTPEIEDFYVPDGNIIDSGADEQREKSMQ